MHVCSLSFVRKMQLITVAIALLQLSACTSTPISCSRNDTVTAGTTPLYVLTLLPFSVGLGLLTGAHIARDEVNNRTDLLPGYHIELILSVLHDQFDVVTRKEISTIVNFITSYMCSSTGQSQTDREG